MILYDYYVGRVQRCMSVYQANPIEQLIFLHVRIHSSTDRR